MTTLSPATAIAEPLRAAPSLMRRMLGNASLVIGMALIGIVVVMALAAPWLSPHDPYAQDLSHRLVPPLWHAKGTWAHPLGTDNLGRDYLSRVIYGARISLTTGFVVVIHQKYTTFRIRDHPKGRPNTRFFGLPAATLNGVCGVRGRVCARSWSFSA